MFGNFLNLPVYPRDVFLALVDVPHRWLARLGEDRLGPGQPSVNLGLSGVQGSLTLGMNLLE